MLIYDVEKTRAIINLDSIAANYRYMKNACDGKTVIAVIKADAYGHGAIKVAGRLEKEGCDFFAVSNINEAMELRENGIKSRILILGYVLRDYIKLAVDNDIALAVDTKEQLLNIVDCAHGKTVKIHIKLDTGMNRTGFNAKEAAIDSGLAECAEIIRNNSNIVAEGIFSHFAVADDKDRVEFTNIQYDRYTKTVKALEELGVCAQIKHICNSDGTYFFKDMHLDAVRLGILLYGSGGISDDVCPSMEFKTKIVNIHNLKKGESVSYGLTYTAKQDMRVAVIGAGYADGIHRCLSSGKGYVLCNGRKAYFLGKICMDMAVVDITGIDAKCGDDAVIFGKSGDEHLSCDMVAGFADTIPYEILCSVSKRVPRIYIENNV